MEERVTSHKGGWSNFYEGEFTPQIWYLNYPVSFGAKSFCDMHYITFLVSETS